MKLQTLFDWYKETREWRKLAKNSKIMYDQMMNKALAKFFIQDKVDYITTTTADEWYDELKKQSLNRAVSVMKVMRRIWNVAKRAGKVDSNPFEKMGLETPKARNVIWEESTVKQFTTKAVELKLPHIALLVEMCYNLGCRPGDAITIKVKDYNPKDDTIKILSHKTKKIGYVPIYQPFKSSIIKAMNSEWVTRWETFLPQFNYSQYGKDYREVREALGLPNDLQLRDLRHTALTEIMESGASDAEGQAISLHSNRDMLNTYANPTLKMARNAMEKRFKLI